MSSIIQDIMTVRSLRKDLRDSMLPESTLNAIESIHNCIRSGTDLNGWKKVDWRGGGGTAPSNYKNNGHMTPPTYQGSAHKSSSNTNSSNSGGFFSSRFAINNKSQQSSYSPFTNKNNSHNKQLSSNNAKSIPLITTPISSSDSSNATQFNSPPAKYVSKFKKDTEKVDDTILNTILLGKLNKFSVVNYDEVKEFITHIIDSGETEMTKCFMRLVFQKAASEEMFCPLYAKLLSELSASFPILLSEMTNLYNHYMKIFEEVETSADNYDELVKRNDEKKYRRGYSQFLAELIKHGVIDSELFLKTIVTIIKQIELNSQNISNTKIVEEYADCLMKVIKAIQSDELDDDEDKVDEIRTVLKKSVMHRISPLSKRNSDHVGITNKARFTILDIYEGIEQF